MDDYKKLKIIMGMCDDECSNVVYESGDNEYIQYHGTKETLLNTFLYEKPSYVYPSNVFINKYLTYIPWTFDTAEKSFMDDKYVTWTLCYQPHLTEWGYISCDDRHHWHSFLDIFTTMKLHNGYPCGYNTVKENGDV